MKRSERRLLDLLLNAASVRRQIAVELNEEDYRNLRTADVFKLVIELERRGEEPTYSRLLEHEFDREIGEDLIPSLLIGGQSQETEED